MTKTVMRAGLFGLAWMAAPLGLVPDSAAGALLALAGSAGLAATMHDRWAALGVASASLGALAWVAVSPWSPALAGALWLTAMLAPRTMRAGSRAAHGAAAALCGAVASWVAWRWGASPEAAVRAAAWGVTGLLSLAPTALPADDVLAFELSRASTGLPEATAARLTAVAALRRRVTDDDEVLASLAVDTRHTIAEGWSSLADVAASRARLGPASTERTRALDARIERQVGVLERIHAAAEARHARDPNATDLRLASAELERDGLEAEAQALDEASNAATAAPAQTSSTTV